MDPFFVVCLEMYAYYNLTLPALRVDWSRKRFSRKLSLHVKHYHLS